jgi:hypothetical protein
MSVNQKLMSLTTAEIAALRPTLKYLGCGEWESPAGDIFDEEDIQHLDRELAGAYLNSLPALVEALRAAKVELNCLIDQATARGYTSGGPRGVVAKIEAALKGFPQ